VTTGVGEPDIGTVIVNVSPTVDCILRLVAGRHTAGLAEIRQQVVKKKLTKGRITGADFSRRTMQCDTC